MNYQKDIINQLTEDNTAGSIKNKKKSIMITLLVVMTLASVIGASVITNAMSPKQNTTEVVRTR